MADIPHRVDPQKLPHELRPLWQKLVDVRNVVFGGGRIEAFIASGGLRDATTAKLFRASASKQQVADDWAVALLSGKAWATPPAVAARLQKALEKLEQFGRRIPGIQLPMRFISPLDVFGVGHEIAAPKKKPRKAKDNG